MTATNEQGDRAAAEAARWLVALADDPDNVALQDAHAAWLAADPAHTEAWRNTAEVYDLIGRLPPTYHPGKAATTRRRRTPAIAAALAACLAIVVALPTMTRYLQADHVTATGELASTTLSDGSTVHLGADSAIAVAYGPGQRDVTLMQGEAFFEVKADADRPFRVAAGGITATALGTAFTVRRAVDGAAIGVRHGRVRVAHAAGTRPVAANLQAGDWIRVGADGNLRRGATRPVDIGAWRDGQLIARDRRLADVIADLRRHQRGVILLTDDALGNKHVSGVYHTGDPVAALRALASTHDGVVRQLSPWLTVVSAD